MDEQEFDEIEVLMQETPVGENHGRTSRVLPTDDEGAGGDLRTTGRLGQEQLVGFMADDGWHVETGTAHRGILQDDEYVDEDLVRALVLDQLGATQDEMDRCYRQGPKSKQTRQKRAEIDAQLLALSRSGANMTALSSALGWPVVDGGWSRPMKNALKRAEEEAT